MRPNGLYAHTLAAMANYPGGVETATLAPKLGTTAENLSALLCNAAKAKLAWPVRSAGPNNRSVWFPTDADRTAWLSAHPETDPALAHKAPKAGYKHAVVRKPRQPSAMAVGVTIAKVPRSHVEATNPNGVQPIIVESVSYDPRYQVRPGVVPFGAGFSAVGVGRDVNTGRGW